MAVFDLASKEEWVKITKVEVFYHIYALDKEHTLED